MGDLQDYFLSSFSTRLMDIVIGEIDNFTTAIIGQNVHISSYLCNPTDGIFALHDFHVSGLFQEEEFADIALSRPIILPPQSVGQMFIDYTVIADWTKLVLPVINTVVSSGLGSFGLGVGDEILMLSFVINTDCVARDTQIALGVQANVPIALEALPEIWLWNESFYFNPTRFWADLYGAVNLGLRDRRFLEWDSLNISGEAMTWVYMIVLLCSVILVSAILLIMLLLLKMECQCRICRRRPEVQDNHLNPICPEKVWGRSVSDLEIVIAEETPQSKPHLTKAMSQSRLEAQLPRGKDHVQS